MLGWVLYRAITLLDRLPIPILGMSLTRSRGLKSSTSAPPFKAMPFPEAVLRGSAPGLRERPVADGVLRLTSGKIVGSGGDGFKSSLRTPGPQLLMGAGMTGRHLQFVGTICALIFASGCAGSLAVGSRLSVGPSAMASCLNDERIMPSYRASVTTTNKAVVAGVKENSREVRCYWGTQSPFPELAGEGGNPNTRCYQDGNICTYLMWNDEVLFIPANSERGRKVLAGMNPNDSGYIAGSRRILAWESANGSIPPPITVPVTVNAPASTTVPARIAAPVNQPVALAPSENFSVVWYLIGRFAEGLAAGYAQSQAQPRSNAFLNGAPRQRPVTCTSEFYNVGVAPVYRCE